MKIEKVGAANAKVPIEDTNKAGKKMPLRLFTRICDGAEHHNVTGPDRSEVCDPVTLAVTFKRDGKQTGTLRISFTPDGKHHTVVRQGTREGKSIEETLFFDRK